MEEFPLPKQLSFANMLQLGWSEGAAVKWRWKYSFKTFYINHTSETVINQCFLWLQKVVAPHCYANLFVTIIASLSLHNNWIFLLNRQGEKNGKITNILSKVEHLRHKLRKGKRMKINSVYSLLTVIWLLILRDKPKSTYTSPSLNVCQSAGLCSNCAWVPKWIKILD